jgi:hypothetical protein
MKKKKLLLFFVDILTAILLIIHMQSTIVLIIEDFSNFKDYTLYDYLNFYDLFGIAYSIRISQYYKLYVWLVFIVFCFNIYAAIVKLKDINNRELVKGIYSYFLLFNVAFVVIKTLEFYVYVVIVTHA